MLNELCGAKNGILLKSRMPFFINIGREVKFLLKENVSFKDKTNRLFLS